MVRVKGEFIFGAAATTAPKILNSENGLAFRLIVDCGANASGATASVTITDTDGYVLFTATGLAANTIHYFPNNEDPLLNSMPDEIPLDRRYTISCALNEAPGAGGQTIYVMLYVKRNNPY